ITIQVLLKLCPWERVQLLNTSDCCILDPLGFTVLDESSVHLSSTQDDTIDLIRLLDRCAVTCLGNDTLELRVFQELFDVRASERVAEEKFGEEYDEWFPELAVHLSAQDVEHVRCSGHVGNLHITVLVLAFKLFG